MKKYPDEKNHSISGKMNDSKKTVIFKSCIQTARTVIKHLALYTLPLVILLRPERRKMLLLLWVVLFQIVYILFAEFCKARKNKVTKITQEQSSPPPPQKEESTTLALDPSLIAAITSKLEQNESYLNPEITIKLLSKELKVSTNELSSYFNHHLHMTFKSYINKKRVEYSIQLVENNFDKYTIDYIAKESGFQNRTTYYRAFKKLKQVSPTVYYEIHHQQTSQAIDPEDTAT